MPRTPSVRYFTSKGGFYSQFRKRRYLLAAGPDDRPDGPVYRRAVAEFARLCHLGDEGRADDDVTLLSLCDRHQAHLKAHAKPETVRIFRRALAPALARFGGVAVRDLRAGHVQE